MQNLNAKKAVKTIFILSMITNAISEVGKNTVFAKKNAKNNERIKIRTQVYHFISLIALKNEMTRLINSKNSKPPPNIMIIKNNEGFENW